MKRLLIVFFVLMAGPALAKPRVTAATIAGTNDEARVDLILSSATPLHVLYLANPCRIVIDMATIDWQVKNITPASGNSLVTGLRYGMPKAGTSRIVLDLAGPARIARTASHEDKETNSTHLRIDLAATDAQTFQRAVQAKSSSTQQSTVATAEQEPKQKHAANNIATKASTVDQAAKFATSAGSRQQPTPAKQADISRNKEADRSPLLTDVDKETLYRNQQADRDAGGIGYKSSDGYFITYMHPDGSLFGGGVTIGTQF